jgi:hypothetical protein
MAADSAYWERVIFPTLVGLASDALGVTVIHCACVERDGAGLLLAGESGAGKSTLSLAMARCGFAFLSDDWTYLSYADEQLLAWGLNTPLKLLPDAVQHFPELRALEPGVSLNGERAFEADPKEVFGVRRCLRCEPRWLVFLERRDQPGLTLTRMPPEEAARRLGSAQGRLPPGFSELRKTQRATIRSLVERECWLLQHGEDPEAVSHALHGFCAISEPRPRRRIAANQALFVPRGPDPTRRLTPTPFVAGFTAAGCSIRLETNDAAILRLVGNSLDRSKRDSSVQQRFLWRLVDDESAGLCPTHSGFSSVAADGIQLVNMGRNSFLATDAEVRCAVGFLSEEYVKDERRFAQAVLPRLINLTAAAVRWKADRLAIRKYNGSGLNRLTQ